MPVSSKALSLLPANEVNCAGEEPRCICIIQDYTEPLRKQHSHTLPSSTSVNQLFEEVSKKLHYVKETFEMTFSKEKCPSANEESKKLDIASFRTLAEMGFEEGRNKNYLQIDSLNGNKPKSSHVTPITEDSSDEATTSTAWSYSSNIPPAPPVPLKILQSNESTKNPPRRNALQDSNPFNFKESICRAACQIKGEEFKGVEDEKGLHLRGLVNQAMTCYLNSLIQTLYMTPEFRNALYEWEFDGTEEEAITTIPYQLQRLFLLLQTSEKQAVETKDLTISFGWDSSEAWQQHDIQELCRVMFDALEQKFAKTMQAEIIKLYEGKMKDYVQCSECKYESARTDTYLDIPLTIRPFGSTVTYKTVMEGLQAFVEPETLDGTNQYFCEKCNKKCDAKKGLKFITFPYLLTLQLKRFDFDYSTMHRVKLNDRLFFPEELDLNSFVVEEIIKDPVSDPESDCVEEEDAPEEGIVGEMINEEEEGDYSSRDSGNDDDRPYSGTDRKRPVHHSSDDSEEGSSVDEGIDIESQKSYGHHIPAGADGRRTDEDGLGSGGSTPGAIGGAIKKEDWDTLHGNGGQNTTDKIKGPYVYELFSIMIHSGSAVGGHYYAYIKSFDDGHWYSFNDQVVSPISFEDIEKSYGGSVGRSSYQSSFSSSTNAYMLMYRQYDKGRNKDFITTKGLPEHIKKLAEKEQEKEILMRENKEKEKNMCGIKVYCRHPNLLKETTLSIFDEHYDFHNTTNLQQATDEVYKLLKLENAGAKRENCRLVKYDNYHQSLDLSLDDEEENQKEPLAQLLGGPRISYLFDLLMETREDSDEPFQVYKPGGITVKVFPADYEKGCFMDQIIIRLMQIDTVYHLKQVLAKRLHYPLPKVRMAYEKYTCDIQLLTTGSKTLKDIGLFRSVKIFVDVMDDDEYAKTSEQSTSEYTECRKRLKETRLWKLIDRNSNLMNINVILPEDAPTYVLPPSRSASPTSIQPQSNLPNSPPSLISTPPSPPHSDSDIKGGDTSPANAQQGSTPSSDEGVGSYDGSSGTNTDTQGVEGHDPEIKRVVEGAEASSSAAVYNADEITLFWRSPERDSFNGEEEFTRLKEEGRQLEDPAEVRSSGSGCEDEDPLSSTSVHLRRNSGEVDEWNVSPSNCVLSAEDFQAELDLKFLAAGYSPTSPTSSLKCEDGSSSDSASQTSGEFDIPYNCVIRQQGDGATDSAGSCSTIDSTDTLCNTNPLEESNTNTDDTFPSMMYSYNREKPGDGYPYLSTLPSATKASALPGMARLIPDYSGTDDLNMDVNDGMVDKTASQSEDSVTKCGLCQCGRLQAGTSNTRIGTDISKSTTDQTTNLDTGPGYQCSKCGNLKPQCVFMYNNETHKNDDAYKKFKFGSAAIQDPESGEGLDNITPLFADTDLDEKGAGDSIPENPIPYIEMSSMMHGDDADATRRQRTESSSSAMSDLGWGDQVQQHQQNCYFRVFSISVNNQKCQVLRAKLDKRTPVGWLKRQIQPIIQVPTRQFSIYRLFHGGQETELNSLYENFTLVPDDTRLKVKHERALRKNEYRCKVYQLVLSEDDPVKHLVDWVVRRGLSIREARLLVSDELNKQCEMNVKPENIRLRKKCWRNPGKIFLESDKFGSEILINYNLEIFLEILDHPEKKTHHDQMAVYCRRWRPSTLILDPFKEVILHPDATNGHSVSELKQRLSDFGDIKAENIEWAKPHGIFPCHMNVLEIQNLEWNPHVDEYLRSTPVNIIEDGSVLFYRDQNEEMRELNEKERSELQTKEAARLATARNSTSSSSTKAGTSSSFRPYSRKETALKIYTVHNKSKKKEATTTL